MDRHESTRRDFHKLSMAALGGAVAGGAMFSSPAFAGSEELLKEPHVCRGLNTCKGKGACKTAQNECKGKNTCAGAGKCSSVAKHGCGGENACKGQGGCGEHPGENACKGKGDCSVPLDAKAWKKARANFEAAMKKAGKMVHPAPAA